MIKRPEQRVAVFIDTQNMYHSAKHLYGSRVNFAALVSAAVADRRVVRAIAYVAKSKTGEEQAFFEALMQNGIELKIKDVQEFASGQKKADWDVGMTVDAIAVSDRVDVVVLVTGDGDFVPLVEYLKGHGALSEVVAFGPSTNGRLREVADSFLDLADDPDTFLIHSGHPHPRPANRRGAPGISHAPPPSEDAPLDLDLDMPATMPNIAPTGPKGSHRRGSDDPHQPTAPGGVSRKIRITF